MLSTCGGAQVRKKLYKSSIGTWVKYRDQLASTAASLEPMIRRYEAELHAAGIVAPSFFAEGHIEL